MANDFDQNETGLPAGDKAGKPRTSGFRHTAKRLRQGEEGHLKHRSSLDWRLDHNTVCKQNGFDADIVPVEELVSIVLQSRTGEALYSAIPNLKVVYDKQSQGSQFYPRETGSFITLNPYRPKGDLLNMLTREIRRAWQHAQGVLVNPLSFEPDEAILVNRAQTADALMISIKIAWELKLSGMPDAWDYLIGSPMADISRTFEIKVSSDFRTLNNGEAPRAAYDKFFEDSRTKVHDKRIIHQMLLDEQGYMKARKSRPRVSMELFHKLGEMPNSRNYFAAKAKAMPTDVSYAAVEDRSNANFLWFIKFERSFQEKELQMMEESIKLSAEIVDFAKWASRERVNKV